MLISSSLLVGCHDRDDPLGSLEAELDPDATLRPSFSSLADAPRSIDQAGFELDITLAGDAVLLAWAPQPDATHYTVWHGDHAYFDPGDGGTTPLSTGPELATAHAVAGDGLPHYYLVVAHTATTDERSTTVGKVAHVLQPGFNKIPQPLDTGLTDAAAFADALGPLLQAAYQWDGASQSFQYWTPGAAWTPFGYGPGHVPIVQASVSGQIYEDVGKVPAPEAIQLSLHPGLNLVTVPLSFGDTTASELLAAVPDAWRVGRWDAATQSRTWFEGGADDFPIEAGRDVYVETWSPSPWPPAPVAESPPPPTNPLDGIGTVQQVASGWLFTEGALWLPDEGALLFSDLEADELWRYEPGMGTTLVRGSTGRFTNGMALDASGRRIECQHATQRVVRIEADGSETVLAQSWEGQTLNAPDDVVVGPDGSLYVADPTIGAMDRFGDVHDMPLSFQGVFRLDPAGVLHLVDDVFADPTGVALSPDGDVLYVSDWSTGIVRAYPVHADGSTGPGAVINVEMPMADSMCVDAEGNVFVATHQGLWALRPDGSPWGVIALPEEPSNCAFGGDGLHTLYATAQTSVYAVEMVIPGAPPFGG